MCVVAGIACHWPTVHAKLSCTPKTQSRYTHGPRTSNKTHMRKRGDDRMSPENKHCGKSYSENRTSVNCFGTTDSRAGPSQAQMLRAGKLR